MVGSDPRWTDLLLARIHLRLRRLCLRSIGCLDLRVRGILARVVSLHAVFELVPNPHLQRRESRATGGRWRLKPMADREDARDEQAGAHHDAVLVKCLAAFAVYPIGCISSRHQNETAAALTARSTPLRVAATDFARWCRRACTFLRSGLVVAPWNLSLTAWDTEPETAVGCDLP